MRAVHKALLLAGLHLVLVASLGGKLLYDRATRPRFWLKAAPVDPDLPIRGRYVSLRVEVPMPGVHIEPQLEDDWSIAGKDGQRFRKIPRRSYDFRVRLVPKPDGLSAVPLALDQDPDAIWGDVPAASLQEPRIVLREPLAFFIPERVPDPSRRPKGEDLWVEVTLPRKGPLRPIRLGIMKDGRLTPLAL